MMSTLILRMYFSREQDESLPLFAYIVRSRLDYCRHLRPIFRNKLFRKLNYSGEHSLESLRSWLVLITETALKRLIAPCNISLERRGVIIPVFLKWEQQWLQNPSKVRTIRLLPNYRSLYINTVQHIFYSSSRNRSKRKWIPPPLNEIWINFLKK